MLSLPERSQSRFRCGLQCLVGWTSPISPREPSPEELPVARWWWEGGAWEKKTHEAHSPLSERRANTLCTQNSNAG